MTPEQVRVMAAYFEAAERLADATDDLIKATQRHAGLMSNFASRCTAKPVRTTRPCNRPKLSP